jgi:hypothetical protein
MINSDPPEVNFVLKRSMRDRDNMKDDAIAHLSDQVIALTARLDSIERRQQ